MKTELMKLMKTKGAKCKNLSSKWPVNLSEHFVLDTRNLKYMTVCKIKTKKEFLM